MMGTAAARRSERATVFVAELATRPPFALLVLDEVHVAPAAVFRTVVRRIAAHCVLGLTATLVREDGHVDDLRLIVGPRLYGAAWADLEASGHIARATCYEVRCAMGGDYAAASAAAAAPAVRARLWGLNPGKLHACRALLAHHEARGDKVLVFCETLFVLAAYARLLARPALYGATPVAEREFLLERFRDPASDVRCLLLSSVGDNSINLPGASVIIQVSGLFGSRRQEAQRLGRILRPKTGAGAVNDASFYTLVATGTDEEAYARRRQAYVGGQGYAFAVVRAVAHAPIAQYVAPAGDVSPTEAADILLACLDVPAPVEPKAPKPTVVRRLYTRAPKAHPLFAARKRRKK